MTQQHRRGSRGRLPSNDNPARLGGELEGEQPALE